MRMSSREKPSSRLRRINVRRCTWSALKTRCPPAVRAGADSSVDALVITYCLNVHARFGGKLSD